MFQEPLKGRPTLLLLTQAEAWDEGEQST